MLVTYEVAFQGLCRGKISGNRTNQRLRIADVWSNVNTSDYVYRDPTYRDDLKEVCCSVVITSHEGLEFTLMAELEPF